MVWCWTARKRLNSDLDTLLQLNRQRAEYYGGTTHRCSGNRRTGASGTGVEGLRVLVAEGWASGARLGRGGRRGGVLGAGDGWRSGGERQWRVGASRGVAEWESRRVAEWASDWVSEVRRRRRAVGRHGVGGVGALVDRVWNGSGGFCCVMGLQKKSAGHSPRWRQHQAQARDLAFLGAIVNSAKQKICATCFLAATTIFMRVHVTK